MFVMRGAASMMRRRRLLPTSRPATFSSCYISQAVHRPRAIGLALAPRPIEPAFTLHRAIPLGGADTIVVR